MVRVAAQPRPMPGLHIDQQRAGVGAIQGANGMSNFGQIELSRIIGQPPASCKPDGAGLCQMLHFLGLEFLSSLSFRQGPVEGAKREMASFPRGLKYDAIGKA